MTALDEVIDAARRDAIANALQKAREQGTVLTLEDLDRIARTAAEKAVEEFLSELETH